MKQTNSKGHLTWLLMGIGLVFLISGCAGYAITKDGDGSGYDVYRPEPYLLVKSTGDAQIIWLPNYKERYKISTWNFLGKADFEFQIDNGWCLTGITDKSDNTTIASKLLDIVKDKGITPGEVQLFRLQFNDKGEFVKLIELSNKDQNAENK